MDRKKKLITILGTLVFLLLLVGLIWYLFFRSPSPAKDGDNISIATPKVDEKRIPKNSKFENYEKENQSKKKSNYGESDFPGLGVFDNPGDRQDSLLAGRSFEEKLEWLSKQDSLQKSLQQQRSGEEDQINAEFRELMEMQNQLLSQNNAPADYMDPSEVEQLLQQYDQAMAGATAQGQFSDREVSKEEQDIGRDTSLDLAREMPHKMDIRSYFQGAGPNGGTEKVQDLIPAETVDEGLLFNGSTIALRTKKDIVLKDPVTKIPKGSIIYGRVSISNDRLMIDIQSYKEDLKLYPLDFAVYDFDGREGIHLGNRTWPKIPSKVAKDVYEYAYQSGTQASTFGGGSEIDLDQAKNIAILSAAKHVGNEVFDKRKVYMPKKYHLWFNVQSN